MANTAPTNFKLPTQLFIDGEWRDAENKATFDLINPSTGAVLCKVANGSAKDVNDAALAARRCFETGVLANPEQRSQWLSQIADEIQKDRDNFIWMEMLTMGKPVKEVSADMDDVVSIARMYAELAKTVGAGAPTHLKVAEDAFRVVLVKEPVGVVAGISPWNFPILMTVQKVFAAIGAGCPIVLKPSELAPSTSLYLCQVAKRAGWPAGILNVVSGLGDPTGAAVASNPLFAKTAFTGSVATGKKVMAMAAAKPFPTPVCLELGGKSPCVVFDGIPDDKIDSLVDWICIGIFFNSGQVCSATSRLILQRGIAPKILARIAHFVNTRIHVGDPSQPGPADPNGTPKAVMGPIVSAGQRKKVLAYIEAGIADGAKVFLGGLAPPPTANPNGFFVAPTVLTHVPPTSRVWREEIFGPVLAVAEFDSEEEGVRLANETDYGLAATVMGADAKQCERVSRQLRAGYVWINCNQRAFVEAPWGGFKGSGFGRELGKEGIEEFLSPKTVVATDLGYAYHWYSGL